MSIAHGDSQKHLYDAINSMGSDMDLVRETIEQTK